VGDVISSTAPATAAAPGGATTSYTYDASGEVLTSTDPNGVIATYTYTPNGNAASVSYSGSAAHSVSYTYDAQNHVTGMTDDTGTSSYSYNPFGQLKSATNGAGQTVGYSYNTDGNTLSITYPLPASATWATSSTVNYGYDKADNLTSVTDFNGNQITIGYTADGLSTSSVLGSSGDTVNTTYDPADAISAVNLTNSSATLLGFAYSHSPSGNITSETDTPSSPQSPAAYGYDGQGRVTSMAPGSNATLNYNYDPSGNLTTLPPGASGTYDNASELTSSALSGTTTSYTYNADGERLTAKQGSSTVAAATWNGAADLTAYSDPAANMTAASYNGTGLRTSATATPVGGSAATQQFVWDTRQQALLMDSANAYIYGTDGSVAEQVNLSNGKVTYLVADALGSIRGAVNANGTLAASTSYDTWGNPQTPGGLTSYTPFGYAGGYTDPTGLIYLINRYYDPQTGQFLSVDPAISQTQQPYQYAGDNPVNSVDPNGLWQYVGPCNCFFAHEKDFQFVLVAYLRLAAQFTSWHVLQSPYSSFTTVYGQLRVPDIYIHSKSSALLNWIDELKIGYQSGHASQVAADEALVQNGGGWRNYFRKIWWTVHGSNWWFVPNGVGVVGISNTLWSQLVAAGLNIIVLYYDPDLPEWPVWSGREESNDTVRDIESDNYTAAHYGLREMCGCIA
jgi:RHS repeat-associated protein